MNRKPSDGMGHPVTWKVLFSGDGTVELPNLLYLGSACLPRYHRDYHVRVNNNNHSV